MRFPPVSHPRRRDAVALVLSLGLLGVGGSVSVQAAESTGDVASAARVIVKYKALDATGGEGGSAPATEATASRVQGMSHRLGMNLRGGLRITERMDVVTASGLNSQQLAARLSQDSAVEYAVPDLRRQRMAAPNDPRYGSGLSSPGPTTGQWYLRAPAGAAQSAIDIEGAWTAVAGSVNVVVVAVLDTGVRFDHPDMTRLSSGGTLLDGYDFVTNNFIGNDANSGRDSDASDPGDWVDSADVASPSNTVGCQASDISDSSWHGTQTAGLIGALTNNAQGMAGLTGPTRTIRVLPVRVLGKCGGFDSDIIAGMRWAAGFTVSGLSNATPAKVINLSLGGAGACTQAYRDAIREINAAGVVVVAAAGNTNGHTVNTPANCPGVIAVAGLRHLGSKVAFSDLGPEIALSAPAGNCVNLSGECLYPLLTTTNTGTTTPAPSGGTYTDGFNPTFGTSFSSPLVAGTAALMFAVNPDLTPDDVRTLLRRSARAFPTSGDDPGIPLCQAPVDGVDQDECYCTSSTCGAGMLNASAAVTQAQAFVPGSDSGGNAGGGAFGFGWLAALGVATLALRRTRQRA